jgi:hypothetical protein
MPQSLTSLAVSSMIFVCTFAAAVLGMVLAKKLPVDHLSEESRDVIKLIMGLIATMAALVLGLLIASANSSYQTQSDELQQASASIIELDGVLAHYGPEASEPRQRLGEAVAAAVETFWPKGGMVAHRPSPAASLAKASAFFESIARLSPNTDAQRFIQKRALEISASLRQKRALMLEQMGSSIPWSFLAVLVFWISMLFVGFGLFGRLNTTVVVAFLIGALSVSSSIFLILEMNQPYSGVMRISDAPLRNALAQIGQ